MSFAGMNLGYDSNYIFENKKKNICNLFKSDFDYNIIKPLINNNNGDIKISGILTGNLKDQSFKEDLYIKYWAAVPSFKSISFSSFGLPYPNEEIAFNTNYNSGIIKVKNGLFKFKIFYPNSYYTNQGTKLISPSVHYRIWNKNKPLSKINILKIGNSIPYRTINLPSQRNWSNGPLFYETNNKIRTQEQILLDSAYPFKSMKESDNYWGGKPPM
jgi:hypothetical protein